MRQSLLREAARGGGDADIAALEVSSRRGRDQRLTSFSP
jgi:hypothetical protein